MVFVVDYSVLSRSDSLDFVVGFDAVQVSDATDAAVCEVRCVTDLESDLFLVLKFSPWIFGDEVEAGRVDNSAVLCFRVMSGDRDWSSVVCSSDLNNVPLDIFFDDEPGSAAQT